jgi:hypothetical protein
MTEDTTRRRFVQVSGSAALLALAGCAGDDSDGGNETDGPAATVTTTPEDGGTPREDDSEEMESGPTTFTVRIENTAPTDFYGSDTATGGAIWLTPGAYAVFEESNPMFTEGEAASIGLEALAEAGPPTGFQGEDGLVDELQAADVGGAGAYGRSATVEDPNDPMGEVPGAPPIAPDGAFEFEVTAEPGQRFTFASMYVPSNDVFVSSGAGIDLFEDGDPLSGEVSGDIALFDAGTELNGQPGVDPTGAPAQADNGGARAGATEGAVQPLSAVNDGFDYASATDVVDVQLTPMGDGSFTVRIENTAPTDFYGSDTATGGAIWLTPGAWAVHTGSNPIFTQGEEATIGLEALAEAGPPTGFQGEDGLVDELPGRDGVVAAGAYGPSATVEDPNDPMGEVPGAPPIAPGGAFEFEVTAEPGQRLSFASMYVPSNDVFVSPETGIEFYDDGTPVSGRVTADFGLWDAGTEGNGQPGVDPTGAPAQANNGGARAGATEGVVARLSGINDAYEYADATDVVHVTVDPQ